VSTLIKQEPHRKDWKVFWTVGG